jgi:hypothetical protein
MPQDTISSASTASQVTKNGFKIVSFIASPIAGDLPERLVRYAMPHIVFFTSSRAGNGKL